MSGCILVAEDDDDIRALVAFTLRHRGYSVVEANAGHTALEGVRVERPDLVVFDVGMPGMNGIEVAVAMKDDAAGACIPSSFCRLRVNRRKSNKEINVGVAKYLVKPFAPKELAATVAEVLGDSGVKEDRAHGTR